MLPLSAQTIAPGVDPMTAAGPIAIVESPNGSARHLHVGDHVFFSDDAYPFINVIDQRGALYLVSVAHEGNACGALYAWLHTEDGVPRVTEEFGNCAPDYFDIRSDSETVSVTMWSATNPADLVAFVYDGRAISEVTLDPPSVGVSPGDDLDGLIGEHPIVLFRAAQWRSALRALLGADFEEVAAIFDLSTGFDSEGSWLVATARRAPRRGEGRAFVALHGIDGRIVIAWQVSDAAAFVRGTPDESLNGRIEEALAP